MPSRNKFHGLPSEKMEALRKEWYSMPNKEFIKKHKTSGRTCAYYFGNKRRPYTDQTWKLRMKEVLEKGPRIPPPTRKEMMMRVIGKLMREKGYTAEEIIHGKFSL